MEFEDRIGMSKVSSSEPTVKDEVCEKPGGETRCCCEEDKDEKNKEEEGESDCVSCPSS